MTVDPKKRITWKAIYEHPLLNDKKGNFREMNIGNLKSRVCLGENKKFYDNKDNRNIVSDQSNPINVEFKGAELTLGDMEKVKK